MECQPCGDDEEDTPQTEGEASSSGAASSSSLDEPLPDVPPLPPLKGKPEGKYVSGGSARNGWKPSVVYFKAGAKQGKPACYEEACKKAPAFGFAGGKATRLWEAQTRSDGGFSEQAVPLREAHEFRSAR